MRGPLAKDKRAKDNNVRPYGGTSGSTPRKKDVGIHADVLLE